MSKRLTRIRKLGRYVNKEGKELNFHTGDIKGTSLGVIFYLYQNKRMYISDRDFYENWRRKNEY